MQFPRKALSKALPSSHWVPERPAICIGDSARLHCTGLLGGWVAKSTEVPTSANTWTIRLSFQDGFLCLAVNSDYALGDYLTLSVDIAACSSAFILSYRNVDVVVNGEWSVCHTGLFAMTGGREATIEALSNGVPCVMYIRQGNNKKQLGLVRTLNLDKVRQQH